MDTYNYLGKIFSKDILKTFTLNFWYVFIRNLILVRRYRKYLSFPGPIWKLSIKSNFHISQFPRTKDKLTIVLGTSVVIERDVRILGSATLKIGNNTLIGRRAVIGCNDGINIGNDVLIVDNVSIRDTDHKFNSRTELIRKQGITTALVTIEDDVWIGYGALVTKGVIVGKGSVVGANSVVTRDVPSYSVVREYRQKY